MADVEKMPPPDEAKPPEILNDEAWKAPDQEDVERSVSRPPTPLSRVSDLGEDLRRRLDCRAAIRTVGRGCKRLVKAAAIWEFLVWWFGAGRHAMSAASDMQKRLKDLDKMQTILESQGIIDQENSKIARIREKREQITQKLKEVGGFKKVLKRKKNINSAALHPDMPVEDPTLRITVISARGLDKSDLASDADPYFTCTLKGKKKQYYSGVGDVIYNTQDPVWNTNFDFRQYQIGDSLEFRVYDKDILLDDLIGKAVLESTDFYPHGLPAAEMMLTGSGKKQGYIAIRIDILRPTSVGWGGEARLRDVPKCWSCVVEGDGDDEEQQLAWQWPPFFIVIQVLVCFVVWVLHPGDKQMNGLEAMYPGSTSLKLQEDCVKDFRIDAWRWLSYQFTHVGFNHILMNCLMLLIMGIPLEGNNGTFTTWLMFNLGVFGGACCWMVSDNHTEVVGMSGGCYSLIGIQLGWLLLNMDSFQNDQQKKHLVTAIILCLVVPAADLIQAMLSKDENVSNAAHLGGAVAGLLACLAFGRNLDVRDSERVMSAAAFIIGIGAAALCIGWTQTHPVPKGIFDDVPTCWWRQAIIPDVFGNSDLHCIRCNSKNCTESWAKTVAREICDEVCILSNFGYNSCEKMGWSDIEPPTYIEPPT